MFLFFLIVLQTLQLDSIYRSGSNSYIDSVHTYIKNGSKIEKDERLYLKLGLTAHNDRNYVLSKKLFKLAVENDSLLKDFAQFSLLQTQYLLKEKIEFKKKSEDFFNTYKRFPLLDSLVKLNMHLAYEEADSSRFFNLIDISSDLKLDDDLDDVYDSYLSENNKWYKSLYFKLIQKSYKPEFLDNHFERIVSDISNLKDDQKYLLFLESLELKDKKYSTEIYQSYHSFAKYDSLKEAKLEYLYLNKKYHEILSELKTIHPKKYTKKIRRIIPRTHKNLGQTKQMLNWYLDYARTYPDDYFSQSAVTYVLDKTNSFNEKTKIYEEFGTQESVHKNFYKFREVLELYKRKSFKEALKKIDLYLTKNLLQNTQFLFWKAKILYEIGDEQKAREIFLQLASDPMKDYYTIKSYVFVHENKLPFNFPEKIDNRISKDSNTSSELVTRLKRIKEIFNDEIFFKTLKALNIYKVKTVNELNNLYAFFMTEKLYKDAIRTAFRLMQKEGFDRPFKEKIESNKKLFPLVFNDLIEKNARKRNIDPDLIRALIYRESTYDKDAISKSDAHGLMQLIPETAYLMNRKAKSTYKKTEDLYNPALNILLGTSYLRKLLDRFNNRYEYVLGAYNAGPTRVKRWKKNFTVKNADLFIETIGIEQTRTYIKKVMFSYYAFKLLYTDFSNIYYSGSTKR